MLRKLLNRKPHFRPPKRKLKDSRNKGKKMLVWLLKRKLERKLKGKSKLENCRINWMQQDVLQRNKRRPDGRQKRLPV